MTSAKTAKTKKATAARTATVEQAAASVARLLRSGQYAHIAVEQIAELEDNPRGPVCAENVAELAASMEAHGMLQPLVVRPWRPAHAPLSSPVRFQLRAGHRRLLAAKLLGWEEVPCVMREMSDQAAEEVTCLENLQRENLRPMAEAESVARLLRSGKEAARIAEDIGRSVSWVHRRAKLAALPDAWRLACAPGGRLAEWGAAHLELVCRAPYWLQCRLLDGARPDMRVADLRAMVLAAMRDLLRAPWDMREKVGRSRACRGCAMNTGAQPELFEDLTTAGNMHCLDLACFDRKLGEYARGLYASGRIAGVLVGNGACVESYGLDDVMPVLRMWDVAGGETLAEDDPEGADWPVYFALEAAAVADASLLWTCVRLRTWEMARNSSEAARLKADCGRFGDRAGDDEEGDEGDEGDEGRRADSLRSPEPGDASSFPKADAVVAVRGVLDGIARDALQELARGDGAVDVDSVRADVARGFLLGVKEGWVIMDMMEIEQVAGVSDQELLPLAAMIERPDAVRAVAARMFDAMLRYWARRQYESGSDWDALEVWSSVAGGAAGRLLRAGLAAARERGELTAEMEAARDEWLDGLAARAVAGSGRPRVGSRWQAVANGEVWVVTGERIYGDGSSAAEVRSEGCGVTGVFSWKSFGDEEELRRLPDVAAEDGLPACPDCGAAAEVVEQDGEWIAGCMVCVITEAGPSREEAERAWREFVREAWAYAPEGEQE